MREFVSKGFQWMKLFSHHLNADGLSGAKYMIDSSRDFFKGIHYTSEGITQAGIPIWEKEWDVLLILDACRLDLMNEVVNEYDFLRDADRDSLWSVASMSGDWMERTFTERYAKEISRTAYINGNPYIAKVGLDATPKFVDNVWKYGWDQEISTIPARVLTDRAITTWRSDSFDRMIVHYMQPHVPFVPNPEIGEYGTTEDFGEGFARVWDQLGNEIDIGQFWKCYVDNLRYVLNDVEVLLRNIDAPTVVISSDHGNALGELQAYGHPPDVMLPSIRCVPWITTKGEDREEYQPDTDYERNQEIDSTVSERLRSLGYHE